MVTRLNVIIDLALQVLQVAQNFHVVGAEDVGGLGNLLHGAVQGVAAAGQEVDETAGGVLVGGFQIQDNGALVTQMVGDFGDVFIAVGLDQNDLQVAEIRTVVQLNEGEGLALETIGACDYTVLIPMSHNVDSLNVAAASAVAFWQLGNR